MELTWNKSDILFRGRDLFSLNWLEGFPYATDGITHIRVDADYGNFIAHETFMVDPSTIGIFTGKIDRNKRKIFTGDIVTFSELVYGDLCWYAVVDFEHEAFVMKGRKNEFEFEFYLDVPSARIEVVGNIYDNPELLEGE